MDEMRAIDRLSARLNRPNSGVAFDADDEERKSAIALLEQRHLIQTPKREIGLTPPFRPSEAEITEAKTAISATKNLFKLTDAFLGLTIGLATSNSSRSLT